MPIRSCKRTPSAGFQWAHSSGVCHCQQHNRPEKGPLSEPRHTVCWRWQDLTNRWLQKALWLQKLQYPHLWKPPIQNTTSIYFIKNGGMFGCLDYPLCGQVRLFLSLAGDGRLAVGLDKMGRPGAHESDETEPWHMWDWISRFKAPKAQQRPGNGRLQHKRIPGISLRNPKLPGPRRCHPVHASTSDTTITDR